MSECVKTLIVDGLHTRKHDDTVSEMLPHLDAQAQLDRVATLRREAQSILNKTRQEVGELLGIGANEGAIRYFHAMLDAAEKLPPTEWRDWLIKKLEKEFPDLAKRKPTGVQLLPKKQRAR